MQCLKQAAPATEVHRRLWPYLLPSLVHRPCQLYVRHHGDVQWRPYQRWRAHGAATPILAMLVTPLTEVATGAAETSRYRVDTTAIEVRPQVANARGGPSVATTQSLPSSPSGTWSS